MFIDCKLCSDTNRLCDGSIKICKFRKPESDEDKERVQSQKLICEQCGLYDNFESKLGEEFVVCDAYPFGMKIEFIKVCLSYTEPVACKMVLGEDLIEF